MLTHKFIAFSLLSILALGCGGEKNDVKKLFRLNATAEDAKINYGESVKISLENRKDFEYDSVAFYMNSEPLILDDQSVRLTPEKLGEQELEARIYAGEDVLSLKETIVVYAADAPKIYTYEILNTYPHDRNAFTQGLEFHNDTLYEGTGRNGFSNLRKVDLETGTVLQQTDLNDNLFGEGITIMNNKVYQLTWKSRTGFVYDLESFEQTESFKYGQSKEGWGLTNDGTHIYMSDGTDKIWILDPQTMQETDHIQIVTNSSVFNKANELEFVDGKIYANVWLKDSAMIIDANTGAITGVIDFRGLKNKVTQHDDLDVLNGIAYHKERKTFFVTGKNWDKIFEVRIIEKD